MNAPLPPWKRPRVRRLFVLGLLWLSVATALVVLHEALLPFVTAVTLAYILEPLVTRLSTLRIKARHLPRWGSVLTLYGVFFGLLYGFAVGVVPQVVREVSHLTSEGRDFVNRLTPEVIADASRSLGDFLDRQGIPVDVGPQPGSDDESRLGLSLDLAGSIRDALDQLSIGLKTHFGELVAFVQRLVGGVLGTVFMFFFVLMVTAFILIDWEHIKDYLFTLLPVEHRQDWDHLLDRIDSSLSGVVRGQLAICLVNGALTFLGLALFGVRFAFVLSIIATVCSLIPIFGTILSSVPIVLVGLSQSWKTGLLSLAWILGVHALEAYVLNPKILGSAAKIHPVIVAFALLAGERTYGFLGALFAVPLASILLAVFKFLHRRALEIGAESAAPPRNP